MRRKIVKIAVAIFLLACCPLTLIFADTVTLKSGEKIKCKIARRTDTDTYMVIGDGQNLWVMPNYKIEAIEKDESVISLTTEKGTTYINKDIGLKIEGPSGWHMYSGEELAKAKGAVREAGGAVYKKLNSVEEPFITEVLEFTKYPFAKAYPNPTILISFFSMLGAPTSLRDDISYLNFQLSKIQYSVKDFEFVENPKKIVVNGREGVIATVQYTLSVYDQPRKIKQIVSVFLNKSFAIEISATDSVDNFDINKDVMKACIQSLVIFEDVVQPSESQLYEVMGGGFLWQAKEKKASYVLGLKPKLEIKNSNYLEIEYENPNDSSKPILMSGNMDSFLSNQDFDEKILMFKSPLLNRLEPFKAYKVTVKTYASNEKRDLVDTFTQGILSFLYY